MKLWDGRLTSNSATVPHYNTTNVNSAYNTWWSTILTAVKKSIPHSCCADLICTWNEECQQLYDVFTSAVPGEDADERTEKLMAMVSKKWNEPWEAETLSIELSYSSYQAWLTFTRLTSWAKKTPAMLANQKWEAQEHGMVGQQRGKLRDNEPDIDHLQGQKFALPGLHRGGNGSGYQILNGEKAQGPDNISPEFVIHYGAAMHAWLREPYSRCLVTNHLPKIWRQPNITAILNPNKPADDNKNHCLIFPSVCRWNFWNICSHPA